MIRYLDHFQDGYRYALEKITYNRFAENPNANTEHSLKYTDTFTVSSRDEVEVHVLYERHAFFEPKSVFDIAVSFDLVFTFNNSNVSKIITNEMITELLANSDFTGEIIAKASLLISQITLIGTLNPVVLPQIGRASWRDRV